MYFCIMIFRHLLNMRSHPTWVRGLKQRCSHHPTLCQTSHLTWVRGLKLLLCCQLYTPRLSHPTWVRELKRIRITETRIRTMFYSNSDT